MRNALILTALVGVSSLAGCTKLGDSGASGSDLVAEASKLRQEERALSAELSKKKKLVRDAAKLQKKEAELLRELNRTEAHIAKLRTAEQFLDTQLAIWKPAARESMKGLALGNFSTADEVFVGEAVVKEVQDEQLVLQLHGGEQNFAYDKLPPEIRAAVVHEETIRQKRLSELGKN